MEKIALLVETIIRGITFYSLGLTHACCSFKCCHRDLDDYLSQMIRMTPLNKVEKLQREERNTITQLDDLVEKFTVKFLEEQVSLDEFILDSF